jgi:ATP-binding cassette, subfamily F, member 3
VLSSSCDDFEDAESVYEAIGEILHEVGGDKTEEEIRSLCVKFHMILKPDSEKINTSRKILDAPVLLGQMNSNLDADIENMTSIWVQQRNDSLVSGVNLISNHPNE